MKPSAQTELRARAAGGAIVLRHPRWADFDSWAQLRSENADHLTPWEPEWNPQHLTRATYRSRLAAIKKLTAQDKAYPFNIFSAHSARLVGACNVTHIERGAAQSAKLGYWIGEPFTRKGFARTAVNTVSEFCFSRLGLHRIEAAVQPDNEASIAVLDAAGFAYEGQARGLLKINGQWRDHLVYARLSSD